MTLEEKIGMLHSNTMFSSTGVPRLGIPDLHYSDGVYFYTHFVLVVCLAIQSKMLHTRGYSL